MTSPKLRRAVRGPRSARAITTLLDLLGRRWALRILWELRKNPLSSRALAAQCGGVSPTVLHKRLTELRDATIVDHGDRRGYALSPLGVGLLHMLEPLDDWAEVWARAR